MSIRVRNAQDFLSGLMFFAIAGAALYASSSLEFGSLSSMGPGFFPIILGIILLGFALLLIARSFRGPETGIGLLLSKQAVAILVATVLFGLTIAPLGFLPALLILIGVSSFADPHLSWLNTIVLALCLTVGSIVVFVFLLNQPIAIFGPFILRAF